MIFQQVLVGKPIFATKWARDALHEDAEKNFVESNVIVKYIYIKL